MFGTECGICAQLIDDSDFLMYNDKKRNGRFCMKYGIGIAAILIGAVLLCFLIAFWDDDPDSSLRYSSMQQTETTAEMTSARREQDLEDLENIESIRQQFGTEPSRSMQQSSTFSETFTAQTETTASSTGTSLTTSETTAAETTTGTDTEVLNPDDGPFRAANPGDLVPFGAYNWYVTAKTDADVTLLCAKSVCKMRYDESGRDVTWETCTLRSWLNDTFYNQFSDAEKEKIVLTTCRNGKNSVFGTDGGADTEDYVYLLSLEEANAVSIKMRAVYGWWWLRTPGGTPKDAAVVHSDGGIGSSGFQVSSEFGVRPVLTVRY